MTEDEQLQFMNDVYEHAMRGLFGFSGRCDGIEEGSQLLTRDGRKTGNAHVSGPAEIRGHLKVWPILTDFGNKMNLTEKEIDEFFYPPAWKFALPVKRIPYPHNEGTTIGPYINEKEEIHSTLNRPRNE